MHWGKNQHRYFLQLSVDKNIMLVNFLGPVALTKAVLPHMVERRQGHIVVTSSMQGMCIRMSPCYGLQGLEQVLMTVHPRAVTQGLLQSHIGRRTRHQNMRCTGTLTRSGVRWTTTTCR